jgi:PAS domain S-box-containing protein
MLALSKEPAGVIEDRIREVLRGDQPSIVYQPVVDLRSGIIVGAEALARFEIEPRRTPDIWFEEAWDVGLGLELELKAIGLALAGLDRMPEGTYMTINVAPQTLLAPSLVDALRAFPGDRLVVELTEHARVADYDAMSVNIARLRARGVRLAIDDAGAGFASFQHILELRPDIIKLDRSLTANVDQNPVRLALAAAMVTFAGSLGARICAEGIETAAELAALQKLGVACGQGYYLRRPGPLPLVPPTVGGWFQPRPPGDASPIASPAVRSRARLDALESTVLLDTDTEEDFDQLTRLAARLTAAPIALISLVDDHRQFFKSGVGLGDPMAVRETPLTHSLCQHVVTTRSSLVIEDARVHPLAAGNLAVCEMGVTAYAGIPLISTGNHAIGALCAVDTAARPWTDDQLMALRQLAKMVVRQIELRTMIREHEEKAMLLRTILHQTDSAILLCSIDGRIVAASARLCALLESTQEDLCGLHISAIKHPDDVVGDLMIRDELIAGQLREVRIQTRYRRAGGDWLSAHITASVIRDDRGMARFTLVTFGAAHPEVV